MNKKAYYGEFGGQYVAESLMNTLNEVDEAFEAAIKDPKFIKQFHYYLKQYVGRQTPLYFAERLSEKYGTKIYLKREDLNHTGAHKINNVLGQALLAKRMGAKRVIAETGAGQHGVATATVAALLGLECEIFMGEIDINRQHLNVERMKLLGAKIHSVDTGSKTLADACEAASNYWERHRDVFYILGSAVGPHPYPKMVRFFQSIIGSEIKEQILKKENRLPNYVLACIGGGSNAIGTFYAFLDDEDVNLIGLEAAGEGVDSKKTAASLNTGKIKLFNGFKQYVLVDENDNVKESYSISAGLDYPGCGPEHCYLFETGRVKYEPITDDEAVQAFARLSKYEGIIPAIESAHAVAYLEKLMPTTSKEDLVVVNISGRGDKDTERLLQLLV